MRLCTKDIVLQGRRGQFVQRHDVIEAYQELPSSAAQRTWGTDGLARNG